MSTQSRSLVNTKCKWYKIDFNGDTGGISSPLVKNRHGGDFPQRCCVDKACLVSTVAGISEMATITDNPRNNTRHVVTTG
ncbi:hypothetical protein JWG39_05280 [Desulforhopalus vacuolatus]|uniref:hypothetical protein n=1 Tax=Desulforhopalus vacuolatus TaxID=40414 RepID=UPI001964D9AD|nr:hypothetical protein [Desulforhopalus vacuolatus]MBM9519232.1 hypothetical protein [Desulforhopalus vacuolatus]